jgi:hypothetical protein
VPTTDPALDTELDEIAASLIVKNEPPKRKPPEPKPEKASTPPKAEDDYQDEEEGDEGQAPEAEAEDPEEEVETPSEDYEDEAEDKTPSEDDDDDGAAGDDEDPRDPLHTVKVDGKDTQVHLSELKRSYSGQRYIQQGMAQVAEAKKVVTEEFRAVTTQRAQLAEAIDTYLNALGPGPERPSAQLKYDDPVAYSLAVIEYNEHQAQIAAHKETQAKVLRENEEAAANHRRQVREAGRVFITQRIPDYGHPEKGPALRRALAKTAKKYGFDEDDLREVDDPRLIIALNELRRLKAREAKGQKVLREKVEQPNVRPMIKPGAKRQAVAPERAAAEKASARMKRTGDVDDVAAWLMTKPNRRR